MTLDARTASACARPTAHPLLNRQILRGLVIWEFVPATVAPTWPNVTCNVLRAITALCWRYFTQDPAQLLRPISSWPLRTIMTRLAPCPRHLTICLLENVTATSKVEGFSSPPPPSDYWFIHCTSWLSISLEDWCLLFHSRHHHLQGLRMELVIQWHYSVDAWLV